MIIMRVILKFYKKLAMLIYDTNAVNKRRRQTHRVVRHKYCFNCSYPTTYLWLSGGFPQHDILLLAPSASHMMLLSSNQVVKIVLNDFYIVLITLQSIAIRPKLLLFDTEL